MKNVRILLNVCILPLSTSCRTRQLKTRQRCHYENPTVASISGEQQRPTKTRTICFRFLFFFTTSTVFLELDFKPINALHWTPTHESLSVYILAPAFFLFVFIACFIIASAITQFSYARLCDPSPKASAWTGTSEYVF